MKIDSKIISIPPYLSTTWDQISLLQTEQEPINGTLSLVIHLTNNKQISIPGLSLSDLELIFESHRKYIEKKSRDVSPKNPVTNALQQLTGLNPEQFGGMPIRFGISGHLPGIEGIDMAMQHNPLQGDSPDLPQEVIEKIAGAAKLVTGGDTSMFPKPEAHCNCSHCQIARGIHGIEKNVQNNDEIVTDEELTFRNWDVVQIGESLYKTTNPLDPYETYNVYLGKPIGCTCGKEHCEHIRAVLST